MTLNDDCWLQILKYCSAKDVCNVSRTDKNMNSLINNHIKILPRMHLRVKISALSDSGAIRCKVMESCDADGWVGVRRFIINVTDLPNYMKRRRYFSLDILGVMVFQPSNCEGNSSAIVKIVRRAGVERMDFSELNEYLNEIRIDGFTPVDVQQFLKLCTVYLGGPSKRDEVIDYTALNYFIFKGNGYIHLESIWSRLENALWFIESVLQKAASERKPLKNFFFGFSVFPFPEHVLDNFFGKLREIAKVTDMRPVKKVPSISEIRKRIILKESGEEFRLQVCSIVAKKKKARLSSNEDSSASDEDVQYEEFVRDGIIFSHPPVKHSAKTKLLSWMYL